MAVLAKCDPGDIRDDNLIVRGKDRGRPPSRYGDSLPEPEEQLFIWAIEDGGGAGLRGRATVTSARQNGRNFEIEFRVDEAQPKQPLTKAYLQPRRRQPGTPGALAERLCSYAHTSIVHLTDDQAAWLLSNYYGNPEAPTNPILPEEIERTWALREQRPGQGAFRDALIRRDGPRCAVTGCRVIEVIEAAHLRPFANGDVDRDDPGNGILLRADIHILFDLRLIAVDPASREVWIAPALEATVYRQFRGRSVRTGAAEQDLRWHFDWAQRQPNA